MGFMDKAKKLAEQAQQKLDEAQQQFNAGQSGGATEGPAVEYDEHGRPTTQAPQATTASPPQGDPLAGAASAPASTGPAPDPGAPPSAPAAEAPPSARAAGAPEDRNHPSYEPPKLTSGDPLAG